jgi:ubiquitin carboxyl-terminal hydrolase 15
MPLSMDDSTFEWPIQTTTISYGSSRTSELNTISLIADFGSTTNKRIYNKKTLEEIVEHSSCNSQLIKKKDVISLSDCFNLYTKIEKLDEQDYWYCAKCKNHQPSTKKFDLWSLPPVLVVHLKRFSYSRTMRDKIDTQVEFPLNDLDMSSYLINKKVAEKTSTKYNLIAVSNHYGSFGGGHCNYFS